MASENLKEMEDAMNSEENKPDTSDGGYCLLPWGKLFREGGMVDLSDAEIAVLPVIAIHVNEEGKAWPGYERICVLAGVSKTSVSKAVDALVDRGWITKSSGQQRGTNIHNEYRLQFYPRGDKRDLIRIDWKLVYSGVWGSMPASEKRVYLMFKAFSYFGRSAVPFGFNMATYESALERIEVEAWGKLRKLHHSEVQFLPASIYNPAKFIRLSGVKERTFRKARASLIDDGLIIPYKHWQDSSISGFIIPFHPRLVSDYVQRAIKKAREEFAARMVSSGAKRSMTAMHRRSARRTTP
jgi:hypothetical protein